MELPSEIKKLDETVVNRIAAGEIIQRPANALKELIENSLDAKSTNIQITVQDGGLKLLQIQDNGTGIRKEDMDIVCERFTTSKLRAFDDLRSIATFGFRGEALASMSHVALLTISTKTVADKCGYKALYVDGKLKGPAKPCAGTQGTTVTIENLFYNVATRRKALASPAEELTKIADVVMRYSIHNPSVGFMLKKHGQVVPQVRTSHSSTKINNIRLLYGNSVARELLEVECNNEMYKFKMQALITNPNYSSKRMILLLFINQRLVDSSPIRKMLEGLYSIYLPKKSYPWCYVSLEINPNNVDVNVHPTKYEVRFLHEDEIIEKMRDALDEKLSGNNASRTFYIQARMPRVSITRDILKEVLPEYDKSSVDAGGQKIYPHRMIRTDPSEQKLDKFNFTIRSGEPNSPVDECKIKKACAMKVSSAKENITENIADLEMNSTEHTLMEKNFDTSPNPKKSSNDSVNSHWSNLVNATSSGSTENLDERQAEHSTMEKNSATPSNPKKAPNDSRDFSWSDLVNAATSSETTENLDRAIVSSQMENPLEVPCAALNQPSTEDESSSDAPLEPVLISKAADRALKTVYKYYGTRENVVESSTKNVDALTPTDAPNIENEKNLLDAMIVSPNENVAAAAASSSSSSSSSIEFKSYSVNKFRIQVKLRSILSLRKEIEDNYHEGLRDIISRMTFVGSVDEKSSLVQSGLNLYICDTKMLTEELFYEIMLYDFQNFGVFKFTQPLPLNELALLGLDTEEAGWTEEDGAKEDLAIRVKELLLEKADLLNDYFSINIDKKGNLKSLPVLLDKYVPDEAGLPLYVLRLATEVDWTSEKVCLDGICRETAKFYSYVDTSDETRDWKHVIEHILYPAIKNSLLPPKHFAHDSTILQIASLPDLYKIFERC